MNSYADALESYLIPANEASSSDIAGMAGLGILGALTVAITGLAAYGHKLKKKEEQERKEKLAKELENIKSKYAKYNRVNKSFGSVKEFITEYNAEIQNNAWITAAVLPKAIIVVDEPYANINCETALSKAYANIERFRKFANGDTPERNTMNKRSKPTICIGAKSVKMMIFECDQDAGEFIAEVSNFINNDQILPESEWDLSYSD